jgi:hypothetical protein
MFQTTKDSRDPMMSAIAGSDQDVWSCLTFTSFRPIFLATYEMATSEGNVRRTVLLSNVEQVIELLNMNDVGFFVDELQILTPSHMNDSKGWLLQPLREVSVGESDKHGPILVYKLSEGGAYIDAPRSQDVQTYTNVKRMFSFHPRG